MKISVVMQSYLGEYPDSRSNPEFKFVRAVHSFLSQKHEDRELIIVSDGCDKTKSLYETLYSHHPQIKFSYIAKKQEKKMYETETKDNVLIKYYRGLPRRIGCSMASGDIITYMDSDDIILPNRLSELEEAWRDKDQSYMWASNPVRYLHHNCVNLRAGKTDTEKTLNLLDYGYDIKDTFYLNVAVEQRYIFTGTYALSHRRDIKVQWQDTTLTTDRSTGKTTGNSEDSIFLFDLIDNGRGFRQESAAYVVCHYRNKLWDV